MGDTALARSRPALCSRALRATLTTSCLRGERCPQVQLICNDTEELKMQVAAFPRLQYEVQTAVGLVPALECENLPTGSLHSEPTRGPRFQRPDSFFWFCACVCVCVCACVC